MFQVTLRLTQLPAGLPESGVGAGEQGERGRVGGGEVPLPGQPAQAQAARQRVGQRVGGRQGRLV